VLGAWGPRGDIKVELLAPDTVLKPARRVLLGGRETVIERAGKSGRFLHMSIAGIANREEAVALRGQYLQVPEEELPPLPDGRYYRFQLVGLTVRSVEGRELGQISDVISTPESDVFVISGPGSEILVPATDEIVRDVNVAEGTVTIELVPGLLPGDN